MAHSLKEERIVPPEENGAIGGTPPEEICRKLPDGTLIRCLGEFVEQGSVKIEPEDKVLKVRPSERPKETEQPQEDKMSMEKTDAHPNDEAKRKSKNKSVMSKKQSEVAEVQDTTSAKLDPERSDCHHITGDMENTLEANRVESENSKDKGGKPNPQVNKMQLKYSYREDQWSPVNPESKKQYDLDFLLQFQKECTHKPEGLPNIPDLVLSKANVQPLTLNLYQCGNQKSADFMPHFMLKSRHVQPFMALTEDQKKKKRGKELEKERERKKKEKVLVIYSLPDIKPMLSPWKCGRYDAESEELYRNITSILNKLTPQLFTKLTDKALQLPIDTEEQLKGVIELIFEKAISEPIYSTAYAHMCQKLSSLKVQSSSNPVQIVQFLQILVHNCQQEFEKESEIDEVQRRKEISQLPAYQQQAELELLQEQIIRAKKRSKGNIRFIGELYKLRILKENIMHKCIIKLLKAKDDDSLECLCILMSTVVKDLDHEKAKNRMDQYFDKIKKIIASQKNQPRIRFLMWDLVDLRKSASFGYLWVPRRQKSEPTTIDALHREWDIVEAKKAEELENYSGPSRRRKQALPPFTITPQADDSWNTVTSTNETRTAYDPAKLKLTRMTTADNIQLGPGGRGFNLWGKGTIGASNKNQSTSVPEPTSNRGKTGKEASVKIEPEDKVLKEHAKKTVQDVSPSEKPKETELSQEDKRSMNKTDAHPSDEAKRKSKNKSVMSEKQSEVAVVQDPTSAKLDPEKSDRHDITGDRENVHGADRVESENLKDKEGIPNPTVNKMQLKNFYKEDQWSPVNPEGKKRYDRDFLLQFQKECRDKPDGLPNIPGIVLDRANVQPLSLIFSQCENQKSSDFMKSPRVQMTTANENIQLGPGGRGFNMWSRDSIGASNKKQSTSNSPSSSQENYTPTQANRFSMLYEDATRPLSLGGSGGYSSRDSGGRGQSPISKRSSRERDRDREKEAAIAGVQRISRGTPPRQEQPPPRGSKEMAPPRVEKQEEPTMTDAKVKHTSKATVDKFLNLRDFAEVTRCVSELPSKQRHLFVQATVDHILEKKPDMREAVGVLFHSLMNSNLLTKEQYLTGMEVMIEFAEDMAIDIPKIYKYLGGLMGAMLVGGAEYLKLQATAIKPLQKQEKAGVLLAEILRTASRRIGASKVRHIWQEASLKWEDFLAEGEDVQELVKKKGVEFILDGASAADNGINSVSSQGDWLHVFKRGLTSLLNERPDSSRIFNWIERNISDTQKQHSKFIRALVTIICQNTIEGEGQSCRIDPEILKLRCPVLQRYIDNKRSLELQALYAAQALNHSLHGPPGLLIILFDVLYDEDVVTEEAFFDWKISDDPKESAGKGMALKSLRSFFTWLGEPEAEAN